MCHSNYRSTFRIQNEEKAQKLYYISIIQKARVMIFSSCEALKFMIMSYGLMRKRMKNRVLYNYHAILTLYYFLPYVLLYTIQHP